MGVDLPECPGWGCGDSLQHFNRTCIRIQSFDQCRSPMHCMNGLCDIYQQMTAVPCNKKLLLEKLRVGLKTSPFQPRSLFMSLGSMSDIKRGSTPLLTPYANPDSAGRRSDSCGGGFRRLGFLRGPRWVSSWRYCSWYVRTIDHPNW